MNMTRILAVSWLIAAVPFPTVLLGQDSKLVEAAKKEGGKVIVYGSLENDTMDLIAAALKRSTSAVKGRLRVLRDRDKERSEESSCA